MSETYDPPMVHLPGTTLTPEVVLHRTLNKLSRIKGVVVVVQWDDDSYAVDWSETTHSSLSMCAHAMQCELYAIMRRNRDGESAA